MKNLIYSFHFTFLLWMGICICVWRRIFNKYFYIILILFIGSSLFLLLSKPEHYGNWDLLSELDGEKILQIQISPSQPNWDVNLIDHALVITDSLKIYTLSNLISNCYYSTMHNSNRIWETDLTITTRSRKVVFKIWQTAYHGTIISTDEGEFQNNKLGLLLKKYSSTNLE